ncbi:MAG: DUF4433 domain-containing protein, partial [Desulfovibrio sp.]|nr:DUF4433 domain-containing protein [Desulfovibrio sp.]
MSVPEQVRIYHIMHVDRLPSIIKDGFLLSDAQLHEIYTVSQSSGTVIGMDGIKKRRLENPLTSYPDLRVGACVPFYFCPRSVMLYVISMGNHPDLRYRAGQEPIVHLVADFYVTVRWADENHQRWVFTTSNAGSCYFEDYSDSARLDTINWD